MAFDQDIKKVKPRTVLKSELYTPDTLEREQEVIRQCTTVKEINQHSDMLMQELKDLKKKKSGGFDVSEKYDNLKLKLALVKQMREDILRQGIIIYFIFWYASFLYKKTYNITREIKSRSFLVESIN